MTKRKYDTRPKKEALVSGHERHTSSGITWVREHIRHISPGGWTTRSRQVKFSHGSFEMPITPQVRVAQIEEALKEDLIDIGVPKDQIDGMYEFSNIEVSDDKIDFTVHINDSELGEYDDDWWEPEGSEERMLKVIKSVVPPSEVLTSQLNDEWADSLMYHIGQHYETKGYYSPGSYMEPPESEPPSGLSFHVTINNPDNFTDEQVQKWLREAEED